MCPDRRKHRGAHPEDLKLFSDDQVPKLREATAELSWLLTRNYPIKASLKLVGDQYSLHERQRLAISRAAASDKSREKHRANEIHIEEVRDKDLVIDGFNLIITLEAALGGGLLIKCQDGTIRDLSSVHGSYRSVAETEQVIQLVGEALKILAPQSVLWLLDRPVSNSGRLASKLLDLANRNGWPWAVEVVFNPDKMLISANKIVVTSDSVVIEHANWINLNLHLISKLLDRAWIIDLNQNIEGWYNTSL
jgi:hypothetical protein